MTGIGSGVGGPLGAVPADGYSIGIYDRRAENRVFPLRNFTQASWGRVRDDISVAQIQIPVSECYSSGSRDASAQNALGVNLSNVRSFWHSLVFYREGVRVWRGTLTHCDFGTDLVTLDAKDVMVWPYRRATIPGYDDSYPNTKSVVLRAQIQLQTCLLRDDPNIAAHIQVITTPGDAQETRTVPTASTTVFEDIDDMASNSGLDYTVLVDSIILNDTHVPVGRIRALTDDDFIGAGIQVTEYGMSLATTEYVTSQTDDMWGLAGGPDPYYGIIEQISSPYSEDGEDTDPESDVDLAQASVDSAQQAVDTAANALQGDPTNPTLIAQLASAQATLADATADLVNAQAAAAAKLAAFQKSLTTQAASNLSGRNPAPLVVRVPDGTQLNPKANVGINELVPGVWAPLTATRTLRRVSQWQKLDSVDVTIDGDGEKISVTFSTAPGDGLPVDANESGGTL